MTGIIQILVDTVQIAAIRLCADGDDVDIFMVMRRQRFVYAGLRISRFTGYCRSGFSREHLQFAAKAAPTSIFYNNLKNLCVSAPLR